MNLPYLIPRVLRHFLPERLVRFLLLRSVVIKPGLETLDPEAAVQRYSDVLSSVQESLQGRRVLVFGYGGRFDIGIGLLQAGAAYVSLCDRYAPPDDSHNSELVSSYPAYLKMEAAGPRPRTERIGLIQGDIRTLQPPMQDQRYGLVISTSVYEHLDDVDGITDSLARWSAPGGLQLHFVDLRDHFFRYPFEMLCYPDDVWRRWLNPSSNHNRLRTWDYRRIFERHFHTVEITVLERDDLAFARLRPRIRAEFVSGDLAADAATLIRIMARQPRTQEMHG